MAKGIKTVKSKTGKIYQYDASKYQKKRISKTGRTKLVGKNGRINYNNVKKYKDEIESSTLLSRSEKTTLVNQVDAYVKNAHKNGKILTRQSLESKAAKDERAKMVINTGYDYEEFFNEYKFNQEDWETESNWNNNVYTDPITGKQYEYQFNYNGSILMEI